MTRSRKVTIKAQLQSLQQDWKAFQRTEKIKTPIENLDLLDELVDKGNEIIKKANHEHKHKIPKDLREDFDAIKALVHQAQNEKSKFPVSAAAGGESQISSSSSSSGDKETASELEPEEQDTPEVTAAPDIGPPPTLDEEADAATLIEQAAAQHARKDAEAEQARKDAEAQQARKNAEAEQARKDAEAEQARKDAEAEQARKDAEAAQARKDTVEAYAIAETAMSTPEWANSAEETDFQPEAFIAEFAAKMLADDIEFTKQLDALEAITKDMAYSPIHEPLAQLVAAIQAQYGKEPTFALTEMLKTIHARITEPTEESYTDFENLAKTQQGSSSGIWKTIGALMIALSIALIPAGIGFIPALAAGIAAISGGFVAGTAATVVASTALTTAVAGGGYTGFRFFQSTDVAKAMYALNDATKAFDEAYGPTDSTDAEAQQIEGQLSRYMSA